MARLSMGSWCAGFLVVVAMLAAGACAPAAAPAQQAPAGQPSKPAAQPAAQPAKPAAQAAVELRIGSSFAKGNVITDGLDRFAEIVNKKSNGEIVARVFYQSLGAEQQLTQSVMDGAVDMGIISNGNAARFTNAFYIYDLPFLFKKYDNMLTSLDTPLGRKAIDQFEKDLSVKWLFATSNGSSRDIQTTKKQLKTPADIKGMKIRIVSTPIDLATFKAWGANPTPIDWSQTYSALQQGVAEGMQGTTTFVLTAKLYEILKYNVRLDYQAIFEAVFINGKKFASLSPQHQKLLLDAAAEAKPIHYRESATLAAKAEQELNKLGMTQYTPGPAEYTQWASIREKVWEEVAKEQAGKFDLNLAKQLYEAQ